MCAIGQYEVLSAGTTNAEVRPDPVCGYVTEGCPEQGLYVYQSSTPTSNTACRRCPPGTFRDDVRGGPCTAHTACNELAMPGAQLWYESGPPTSSTDRLCTPVTSCSVAVFTSATASSDREYVDFTVAFPRQALIAYALSQTQCTGHISSAWRSPLRAPDCHHHMFFGRCFRCAPAACSLGEQLARHEADAGADVAGFRCDPCPAGTFKSQAAAAPCSNHTDCAELYLTLEVNTGTTTTDRQCRPTTGPCTGDHVTAHPTLSTDRRCGTPADYGWEEFVLLVGIIAAGALIVFCACWMLLCPACARSTERRKERRIQKTKAINKQAITNQVNYIRKERQRAADAKEAARLDAIEDARLRQELADRTAQRAAERVVKEEEDRTSDFGLIFHRARARGAGGGVLAVSAMLGR